MRMIIEIFTLSLVFCLTLSSNENGTEVNQDELLDEIPDRDKRDAVPQPTQVPYISNYLFLILLSNDNLNLYRILMT